MGKAIPMPTTCPRDRGNEGTPSFPLSSNEDAGGGGKVTEPG